MTGIRYYTYPCHYKTVTDQTTHKIILPWETEEDSTLQQTMQVLIKPAEAAEQLGQGPTGLHLHPGGGAVPYPSVHWSCQEKAGHPGVLTQAYRSIGGASSRQKQQEHLTSEITKWSMANARILPTDTKTTWHHQSPVLPPKQVLDTPIHQKARFVFKIISHGAGRGF